MFVNCDPKFLNYGMKVRVQLISCHGVRSSELHGNTRQVHWKKSFFVVFVSGVVKNVDSLICTSGRIIHLFSFPLVSHYFQDKHRRHAVSFKCSFSSILLSLWGKNCCQSSISIAFFLYLLLVSWEDHLLKTKSWIVLIRGVLLYLQLVCTVLFKLILFLRSIIP